MYTFEPYEIQVKKRPELKSCYCTWYIGAVADSVHAAVLCTFHTRVVWDGCKRHIMLFYVSQPPAFNTGTT